MPSLEDLTERQRGHFQGVDLGGQGRSFQINTPCMGGVYGGEAGRGSSWVLSCRASQRGKKLALNAASPGLSKDGRTPREEKGCPAEMTVSKGTGQSCHLQPLSAGEGRGEGEGAAPHLVHLPRCWEEARGEGLTPNQATVSMNVLTFKI